MNRTPAVGMSSVMVTSSGVHAFRTPAARHRIEALRMRRITDSMEVGLPDPLSRPTETNVRCVAGRTIVPPVARGEQRAGGQKGRETPDARGAESDGASHREAASVRVSDELRLDPYLLAGPDLLSALQQPDIRNRQEVSRTVPFEEPALDLHHLRTERSTQTDPSGIIHIECHLGPDFRSHASGGLQRIAASQKR